MMFVHLLAFSGEWTVCGIKADTVATTDAIEDVTCYDCGMEYLEPRLWLKDKQRD